MSPVATILIIDDLPAGREVLAELLFSPDYRFAFASNGLEALAKAAELTPDLILLDVMMPGMNGFEVCRHIRANPCLAEVPVVMITALDDRNSRLQGLEAGADDFISKPFDWAELQARVRTIIRLNRYRRLLAERKRFEWVIEQSNDGYLLINDEDTILYANPKARLYLGLNGDADELLFTKFLTQVQKQYRCKPAEAWMDWPSQSALSLQTCRYLVCPESNTAHACWLQVTLLDQPARLANEWLIQLRDVTVEINLQRDQRTFHDMLSHKLRTPLVYIATSLEAICEENSTLSNPEVLELSRIALKGARCLRGEIEDILHYLNVLSLIQGKSDWAIAEIPQLVKQISSSLGLAPVAVMGLEDLAQTQLALSRRAMEWILWEVLENARKFHPRQAPLVTITLTQPNGHGINLKIADDGLTLSPQQLAQVWIPYYQGEKYFTGQVAGMGLGLSIVASLVWSVGGISHLYNRDGGPGVVVELFIPIIQRNQEQNQSGQVIGVGMSVDDTAR